MGYWSVGSECVKKLRAELAEKGVNPDDLQNSQTKCIKSKAKTKEYY